MKVLYVGILIMYLGHDLSGLNFLDNTDGSTYWDTTNAITLLTAPLEAFYACGRVLCSKS